jgi:hypothetical protein
MKRKLFVPILTFAFLSGVVLINGCIPAAQVLPQYGTVSFYTNSYDNIGSFTVTVDGSNIKTISSTYSECGSYYSNSQDLFSLTVGNHSYVAQDINNTRRWSGNVSISDNQCNSVELYANTSTLLGTSTSSTAGVITDPSGISIALNWTVTPANYYYAAFNYATFYLEILNYSSNTVYTSSTNSYSFQSVTLPYSSYYSIADGYYYVLINPYSITSGYTAQFSLVFSGQSTSSTVTLNSNKQYTYSSSYSSYFTYAKILKSGNTYTISLY